MTELKLGRSVWSTGLQLAALYWLVAGCVHAFGWFGVTQDYAHAAFQVAMAIFMDRQAQDTAREAGLT